MAHIDQHSDCIIFSTRSSAYFADLLASSLGIRRGNIIRKQFGDGEEYYRLDLKERLELVGKDVIFVTSTASDVDFLELVRVGTALADYGSKRRIFCIPFLGYSTMERAVQPGEIVSAKVNCRMLNTIPNTGDGNVFLLMDLHVAGILHYFEGDALRLELYAESILTRAIQNQIGLLLVDGPKAKTDDTQPANREYMFASADLGRPMWVETFSRKFGTNLAFIRKHRAFESVHVADVIGDVRNKHVIIYDDMIRSGATLLNAVDEYLHKGALSVSAVVSHFALNNEGILDILLRSPLKLIIATNSHPMSQLPRVKEHPDRIWIIDASEVFAQALTSLIK